MAGQTCESMVGSNDGKNLAQRWLERVVQPANGAGADLPSGMSYCRNVWKLVAGMKPGRGVKQAT